MSDTFQELALFHRTLAEMVRAEMPLGRAFELLAEDLSRGPVRDAADALAKDVAAGTPLGEAYRRCAPTLPPLYGALIDAGIATGSLAATLEEIAGHAALRDETRRRVRSALTYPLVTAVVIIAIGLFMTFFLSPIFESFRAIFFGLSVELPVVTSLALEIGGSGLALLAALFVLALAATTAYVFASFRSPIDGARGLSALALKMPVVGRLRVYAALAQVAGTLAVLLRRGTPAGRALELVTEASDEPAVRERVAAVARAVGAGKPASEASREAGLFPPSLLWLMSAAEGKGTIADALDDIAAIYRARLERAFERSVRLIEPVATMLMAFVVFGFVYVFIIPLFTMFLPIMKLGVGAEVSIEALLGYAIAIGICLVAIALLLSYVWQAYLLPRARIEMRAYLLETLAAGARRGLPLGPVLEAAAQDLRGGPRRAILRAHGALSEGRPLSAALQAAGSAWFPRHVVAAVGAAEAGGDLAGALAGAGRESHEGLSVVSALHLGLAYPLVVLGGLTFTYVFIFPKFAEILEGMGLVRVVLMFLTAMSVGAVVVRVFFALIVASVFVPLLSWSARYSRLVERALDLSVWLPVVGGIAVGRGAERALLCLAAQVRAGRPLGDALASAAPSAGYVPIVVSIERAAAAVQRGVGPEEALRETRFPAWARIRAGAALAGANARASDALEAIAAECGRRRKEAIDRAVAFGYPAMVILLAVPIFFMYAANFVFLGAIQGGLRPW